MNKGFLFAVTTVFLLISVVLLLGSLGLRQSNQRGQLFYLLLGNKLTYTWWDVDEEIRDITRLDITRENDTVIFNDELPAVGILDFLGRYQTFIEKYYETPDLKINFTTPDGYWLDLTKLQAKVRILPQGLSYEYEDWGKNRLTIKSSPENFSFVDNINISYTLKNVVFNCNVSEPGDCNPWAPDNRVSSCTGIDYCLKVNLTVTDADGVVFNYPDHLFDVGGTKKSTSNLNVKNTTAAYSITTQFGPLSDNTVMDINLHSVEVKTRIVLDLNTSDFYIEYLSKLLVNSSNFETYKFDYF